MRGGVLGVCRLVADRRAARRARRARPGPRRRGAARTVRGNGALAELWKSIGVRPDAVIGHSQGEIAAAYVVGALSLRDAARVVTLRSKLLLALAGRGGMASLACGPEQARELSAPYGDRVSIAAINGPSAVVLEPGRTCCARRMDFLLHRA